MIDSRAPQTQQRAAPRVVPRPQPQPQPQMGTQNIAGMSVEQLIHELSKGSAGGLDVSRLLEALTVANQQTQAQQQQMQIQQQMQMQRQRQQQQQQLIRQAHYAQAQQAKPSTAMVVQRLLERHGLSRLSNTFAQPSHSAAAATNPYTRQRQQPTSTQTAPLNNRPRVQLVRPTASTVRTSTERANSSDSSDDIEIVAVTNKSQSANVPSLTVNSQPKSKEKESNAQIDLTSLDDDDDTKTSAESITNRITGAAYAAKAYWEQFHEERKNGDHFEWFCDYSDIREVLDRFIGDKGSKICEIGSGLSSMASRMVLEGGYRDIVCVDWCARAVRETRRILRARHGTDSQEAHILEACVKYVVADIRELHLRFAKRTFDVVLDKGTMDAVDCGDDFEEVVRVCGRMHEMLKPNGLFIIVTSRSVEKRMHFVDELRRTHKRLFKKVHVEYVKTLLKDWRDGDALAPKLIVLRAVKNSRGHSAAKHHKH